MPLEQAAYLSQIVGTVAVVASLIFVGVQLWQNARAVRAATSHAHAAVYNQVLASVINDATFARIWRLGLDDLENLDPDEHVRFFAFTTTLFRYYESSWVQWRRGQLDAEHWHTIVQHMRSARGLPGVAVWWGQRKDFHSLAFQAWYDSLAPLPGWTSLYPGAAIVAETAA